MHLDMDTVAVVCLLVGAVTTEIRRSWQHGGTASMVDTWRIPHRAPFWRRGLSWLPTLLLVIGAALFFTSRWRETKGFDPSWPDAIKCEMSEGKKQNDRQIFYFVGLSVPRRDLGEVAVYVTPGGANYRWDKPDTEDGAFRSGERYYVPHSVWFYAGTSKKGQLIDPSEVTDTPSDVPTIQYKTAFPNGLNCEGKTIEEIKAKGNAFSFATKIK